MTTNVTLAVLAGLLFGGGVYLLMARGIVRAFLGVLLMSNGINLLFLLASGPAGRAPIVADANASEDGMADPLPQAMVLTAIVITVALTGYVLALAYRATRTAETDAIHDDTEDARILAGTLTEDEGEVEVLEDPAADDDADATPGRDPAHDTPHDPAHDRAQAGGTR